MIDTLKLTASVDYAVLMGEFFPVYLVLYYWKFLNISPRAPSGWGYSDNIQVQIKMEKG